MLCCLFNNTTTSSATATATATATTISTSDNNILGNNIYWY